MAKDLKTAFETTERQNYMKQIAAMLGVPMNVELTFTHGNAVLDVILSDNGLLSSDGPSLLGSDLSAELVHVLTGAAALVEKPFKPIAGQRYWYYSVTKKQGFHLERTPWAGSTYNILCFKAGNCYRSCEAAKKDEARMKALLAYE